MSHETSILETSILEASTYETTIEKTPVILASNISSSGKINDDVQSIISDNNSNRSSNFDENSVLLVKIISNLEERLNSLETKENKKTKKNKM